MGKDDNARFGQTGRSGRLLGRSGEIAAGLVLLLIGVLGFTVFQFQDNEPGDDRRRPGAGVGAAPAGEIAFARDRDGDGRGELTLINADGTDQRSIPNTIEGDSSLAWSPNGDQASLRRHPLGRLARTGLRRPAR